MTRNKLFTKRKALRKMNTADPIRNPAELARYKNYYLLEDFHPRNYVLVTIGLNSALRISDLLTLRWKDVYDFDRGQFLEHLTLTEQKTGKRSSVFLNKSIRDALRAYMNYMGANRLSGEDFLFPGYENHNLSRIQAWRIIKNAADACCIQGVISPHSLRKTFGYQAWKNGVPPVLLMDIFQHSSFETTQRYLGICQDERDDVFRKNCI